MSAAASAICALAAVVLAFTGSDLAVVQAFGFNAVAFAVLAGREQR